MMAWNRNRLLCIIQHFHEYDNKNESFYSLKERHLEYSLWFPNSFLVISNLSVTFLVNLNVRIVFNTSSIPWKRTIDILFNYYNY